MTSWNGPAIGSIIARIVELTARVERVRVETRARAAEKTLALAAKVAPR